MPNTVIFDYCQADIFPITPNNKTPLHSGWRTNPPLNGSVNGYIALGYNVGYRIPRNVLIIDIDPRQNGHQSFTHLPEAVQKLPVTVFTRDKGRHIYIKLPDGINSESLRSKLPEYQGIDFLHYGRYVVLPGSTMPDEQGNPAQWSLAPSAVFPPPEAPPELLDLLLTPEKPLQGPISGAQYLSSVELESVLSKIPVTAYRDNASWLQVLMAAHHATQGDGLEIFLQWSLQDDLYAGHETKIIARWNSMVLDKSSMVTIRSLIHVLARHAPVPSWLTLRAGMEQPKDPASFFGPILNPGESPSEANFRSFAAKIETETNPIILTSTLAVEICSDSQLTGSMQDILLRNIAKKVGTTATTIKKDIRELTVRRKKEHRTLVTETDTFETLSIEALENLDKDQLFTLAAKAVLMRLTAECQGVSPVFCHNAWWLWDGKQWNRNTSENHVQKTVCAVLLQAGLVTVTDTSVRSIESLLQILRREPEDFFDVNRDRLRIFTPTVVLEYDKTMNQWVLIPHEARNKNRYVLGTRYDPSVGSSPPVWLSFLEQVTTSEHARRTIACGIVYSATDCRPWLRKCFYFYGPKRSGKSTTLNCIENILGPDNCAASSLSQIGSRHGGISLLGKLANISNEMLSKKAIQDDIFKQLISGESISVEPKFKDPFSFKNTAKLWFGANLFPKVNDDSDATWDRITPISFPIQTPFEDADHDLDQKLFMERSQILNWALLIFAEEYAKDQCRSIMEPDFAGQLIMQEWQEVNNPALSWAKERLIPAPESSLPAFTAYQDYTLWCKASGHYISAINHFTRLLGKSLYRFSDASGAACFGGVSLKNNS